MIDVINPATEELITSLLPDNEDELSRKFSLAQDAQKEWASTSLKERKAVIARFDKVLSKHKQDCARTLTKEMGKPITQALHEVEGTSTRISFFLEHMEKTLQDETVLKSASMVEKITYEPLGVIANISAWNYPYFVGSNVFIPALLTGNAVLYKPSEFASLTGGKIAQLFEEAGLPVGLFQVVIGGGNTGSMLLEKPLNGVFFTGSVGTGRKISAAVASRFIRVGLELGGKDPAYVCDDVDVGTVAENLVDGAFYNAGQSCCSVERIYIHEKVFNNFTEAFCEKTKKLVVGDPLREETYIGPLARKTQINFLNDQVADAQGKGALILVTGGAKEGKGWYYRPVVLGNVDHSMKVMREESFGPIIGLMRVKNDSEAVKLMQDTTYGLTASVYTKDGDRASEILGDMNTGTVYWNCCDRVSPALPWTGRRDSGLGSTLSKIGILSFVQPKAWHMRKT
ncbi:MAG: aldehyde dehydrogenase family protein [Deltaproteobacteria bacterium]|nr:aldehyde dehydrogenase family protein [Deltaproteobacteria bacterium]